MKCVNHKSFKCSDVVLGISFVVKKHCSDIILTIKSLYVKGGCYFLFVLYVAMII